MAGNEVRRMACARPIGAILGLTPLTVDTDFLSAALVGYQRRLEEIDARMADLRKRIGAGAPAAAISTAGPVPKKRRFSPKGRARIIAAVRKRWAAVRKAKAEAAMKVATPKPAAKGTKPAVAATTTAAKPTAKRAVRKSKAKTAKSI